MMPHHWALIVLAAFAGVPPLGGVRDLTGTVEPRPKVNATELFLSNELMAVRMESPVFKADKSMEGGWTGVSTTWFGKNVAKFDYENKTGMTSLRMRPTLRRLGLMPPEVAMKDQPQGFFPQFRGFGDLQWYLLLDAKIATSSGALACHRDLGHSRRGKYYNETGNLNNPRERDLQQAQKFIQDQSPDSDATEEEWETFRYFEKETYPCFPCKSKDEFLGLQNFMHSSSGIGPYESDFFGFNDVYCAEVKPEAIVGLMHKDYVYQSHEEYWRTQRPPKPTSTIKAMVKELEKVLGAKLGAYMYGINAAGKENDKFWPIEMDLTN